MTAPTKHICQADLDALAHSLAYTHATSVIDTNCVSAEIVEEWDSTRPSQDWGEWFDVSCHDAQIPQIAVDLCVRYLEARGLLERHVSNDTWVKLLDESEATR